MAIEQTTFDLSMVSPDTGRHLTANVYTIDGVTNADNSLRLLSIGQLVMAICLQRAAELETRIINLMEIMNSTSKQLEDMTAIEQAVIDDYAGNTSTHTYDLDGQTVDGRTYRAVLTDLNVIAADKRYVTNGTTAATGQILYDDFITQIEAKMDEKNTFSQQNMIELQSLTNKRDQSYDMVSNVLKSLNSTIIGNVNNM